MRDWLQVVWKRSSNRIIEKMRNACNGVIKVHLTLHTTSVVYAMNTDLAVVTGGLTSQLHTVVNKPFKDNLKQLYSNGCWQGSLFSHNQNFKETQCRTTVPADQHNVNRSLQK
jgi:hypothetical protein